MKQIFVGMLILLAMLPLAAQKLKSPTRAALYSAVIPGGGQLYNRSYLKAGAFFALEASLAGAALYHDAKADDYKDKLNATTDATLQREYRNLRKDQQDLRTRFFWLLGFAAAGSVLDAYVEAHLDGFEAEKSKLHLRFEGNELSLELRF